MLRVLVIGEDAAARTELVGWARDAGFETAESEELAVTPDVGVVAIAAPDNDVKLEDIVSRVRLAYQGVELVVHRRGAPARMVREALRAGAADFFDAAMEKPEAWVAALQRAVDRHANEMTRMQVLKAAQAITEEGLRALVDSERRSFSSANACRALVVAHDPEVRRMFGELLSGEGLEVSDIAGPIGFMGLIESESPSLLVVEHRHVNGLSLFREAHSRWPRLEGIVVIADDSADTIPLEEPGILRVVGLSTGLADEIRPVIKEHVQRFRASEQLALIKRHHGVYLERLQQFRDSLDHS